MSKTLIAVGGTGQHTVLAYLHLAVIGDFQPAKSFIFDADQTSDPHTTLGMINSLIEANREYGFTMDFKLFDPKPIFPANSTGFRDIFIQTPADSEIMSAFFERDQQNTDINEGFYAQPMVGAICIKQKLSQMASDDKNFANFESHLLNDNENLVVTVSSNFGGTGAGGAPVIGEHIWNKHRQTHENTNRLFHALISHHKWYTIIDIPPDCEIKDSMHESNSTSGLYFYEDKLTRFFDKIIMLGLPKKIDRKYSGKKAQQENRDLPYLLSALLANRYFSVDFGVIKRNVNDDCLNQFVDQDQLLPDQIRLTGNTKDRDRVWQEVSYGDSLEGNITLSYFLHYLLAWMAEYIESPWHEDSLLIENHFPKEFDQIIKTVNKEQFSRHLKKLADNLADSLNWLAGFNRNHNSLSFKFKHIPGCQTETMDMCEIVEKVSPEFKKAFKCSFKQIFMGNLQAHFANTACGQERELALEVKTTLRNAMKNLLK